MDYGHRSPLVDLFRRGEATPDVRLLAARGAFTTTADEQIALLVLLCDDADPEIATQANATIAGLPREAVMAFLGRTDLPAELRAFFAARGIAFDGTPASPESNPSLELPMAAAGSETPAEAAADAEPVPISSLAVGDRIKLAMTGSREQRGQLVRDPNRIVSAAVLSSPKLTEAEVEQFAKMGNVSEDVLRIIGTNRNWLKNYGVMLALTRNPKTPPAISMQLMHRLMEKDVKMMTVDRNVPELLRLLARRIMMKANK